MAQRDFKALLFDTRSIQQYIFSGNKLRTNVGASYIVDRIFFDVLIDGMYVDGVWVDGVLREMFPAEDFPAGNDAWEARNDLATPWVQMNSCCVAYVGGGNALLLFDTQAEDRRVEVVEKFTRRLLAERPGLKVGAAHGDLSVVDGKLDQDKLDKLYLELKLTQNKILPAVNVPYSGLTLSCEVNGEAANFCKRVEGDLRFFSQEVAIKENFAAEANRDLKDRFADIFELKNISEDIAAFDFPMMIEDLGQKSGENFFAIVHVDGNNMGLKFRTCRGLTERRRLSREIRRKTEGAFADLLGKIVRMTREKLFGNALTLTGNFLPIRPLIIGGDDVTFLCPANMAILFTRTLLELLDDDTIDEPEHLTQKFSRHMDACAGVAILPTKYPFFRGYRLAEQLCGAAKKSMRQLLPEGLDAKDSLTEDDIPHGSSWLDFAILHGEQAPTLEQIRAAEYRGAYGEQLHFGPYVVRGDGDPPHRLENLIHCAEQFLVTKKDNAPAESMANNKVKELRRILQRGRDEASRFREQLAHIGQRLPTVTDWKKFEQTFFSDEVTPYVDAIELTDFYVEEVVRTWQRLT